MHIAAESIVKPNIKIQNWKIKVLVKKIITSIIMKHYILIG
jgi:hypothetical protein